MELAGSCPMAGALLLPWNLLVGKHCGRRGSGLFHGNILHLLGESTENQEKFHLGQYVARSKLQYSATRYVSGTSQVLLRHMMVERITRPLNLYRTLASSIGHSLCACVCVAFQLLNQLNDIHEIWHERYATGGHANRLHV